MKKEKYRILLVDDDKDILELLKYNLEKEGYKIKTALNGTTAVKIAGDFTPHLILLDIMMPGQDGVETCRQLREIEAISDTHIIFLTARHEEYSEIAAFGVGADDYITKPIKPRALMSRIQSLYQKTSKKKEPPQTVTIGDLVIDKNSYVVKKDGMEITLPKKEFELLYYLALNPNKVFSRDDLLYHIWGADVYVLARTVDVHVRKIREKIGDNYISTVKGVGYKFDPS